MIKIMADSTCDLTDQIIEKYDLSIAPLTIHIEDQAYRDRIDIHPNEFYSMIEGLDKEPTTAMPSPTEYITIFEKAIADGYTEILCICMSSGTSGSYQSAVIAKDHFFEDYTGSPVEIYILDSQGMSHGSGWLILKSARLREQGATFSELIAFNETHKTLIKHFLSVDDLHHLIKSGRISNVGAFIGEFLMLKPIMTMKKGKGAIVAKVRGRKKVLEHYVHEFIRRYNPQVTDFIIIGYTSDMAYAENLRYKISHETDFIGEILIMQMGVAVGTHVGLGAVSMFFAEKRL